LGGFEVVCEQKISAPYFFFVPFELYPLITLLLVMMIILITTWINILCANQNSIEA